MASVCGFALPTARGGRTARGALTSRHTDRLVGRDRLLVFFNARVPQMQQIPIRHQADQVILSGSRGAFRARVIGPDGRELGFLGWVETRGDRLQSYLVAPENFAA